MDVAFDFEEVVLGVGYLYDDINQLAVRVCIFCLVVWHKLVSFPCNYSVIILVSIHATAVE